MIFYFDRLPEFYLMVPSIQMYFFGIATKIFHWEYVQNIILELQQEK